MAVQVNVINKAKVSIKSFFIFFSYFVCCYLISLVYLWIIMLIKLIKRWYASTSDNLRRLCVILDDVKLTFILVYSLIQSSFILFILNYNTKVRKNLNHAKFIWLKNVKHWLIFRLSHNLFNLLLRYMFHHRLNFIGTDFVFFLHFLLELTRQATPRRCL